MYREIKEKMYKRRQDGSLIFKDHDDFRPNMTPKQCIQAGIFGGIYFNPRGGKPGILSKSVNITDKEFPESWFKGLSRDRYKGLRYNKEYNKYGVVSGKNQEFWERKGWINKQDPRGWFQWYCRFFMGRRSEDDVRQIHRWKGVAGENGRWRRYLENLIKRKNGDVRDYTTSPVIRQLLLHWAFELDRVYQV